MSGGGREPYAVEGVKVRRDLGKSLLVVIDGDTVVIPKSLILDDSEVWAEGDEGKLVIPEWLAIDREI